MRISDWSSDVCSSDLLGDDIERPRTARADVLERRAIGRHVSREHSGRRHGDEHHAGVEFPEYRFRHHSMTPTRAARAADDRLRSEGHTSEIRSLMRLSYAV